MSDEKKGPLGLFDLVSFGIGGTIGSGIFVVPAVAASMAGPSSILAWALCAVSFGCVLACLMWLSRKYAGSGAFYTLFEKAYGKKLCGFIIFMYIISGILGIATIAAAIGGSVVIPGVHPVLLMTSIVVLFGIVNFAGVVLSAWVEDMLTILKIVPLIIIPLILLPFVDLSHFTPFAPYGSLSFLGAAVVIYWCFTGFELSAIPSKEVRDPGRTVPKSLLYVFIAVTAIYLILNVVLIGSAGAEGVASSSSPLSYVVDLFFPGLGVIVLIIAIVSMMSALNAYLLGTAIVLQRFAGQYDKAFLKESKSGAPVYAVILCTALGGFMLLFTGYFPLLASLSVIATLIPYVFLCIAAYKLIERPLVKMVAVAGVISTVAILASSLLMV